MLFEGVLVKLAPKMHPLSKVLFFKRTPFLAHAFRVHAFSSARFLERTLYINKVIFFQFNSGLACRWPHLHIQLEFTGGILWPSNFLCGLGYCLPRLFSKQSFERYWMCNESWWRFQEEFRRLFVWWIDRGWIQGVGCYGQSLDQFCHLWVNYNFCKRKTRRENLNFLFRTPTPSTDPSLPHLDPWSYENPVFLQFGDMIDEPVKIASDYRKTFSSKPPF